MPFFTEDRIRQSYLEEIRTPLGATLRAAFEQGAVFNPVASLERSTILDAAMYGRQIPNPMLGAGIIGREPIDSPIVDAETAKSRVEEFGLDLEVPAEGIPQRALEILIERKREERVRQDTIDRGPTSRWAGALRIGAAFAASLLDPINVASAFVPVVGQARYAAMLARASRGRGAVVGAVRRAGVRARVGVIEGTVGAALVEPIVYNAAITEQADYDLLDSLTNIAFGGVLGGGLHIGAGAISDTGVVQGLVRRVRRTPAPEAPPLERLLDAAAPETREALLRTAVARLAEGRSVDVEALARLDPVLRGEAPGATGGVDIDLAALAREVPERGPDAAPGEASAATPETAAPDGIPFVITQAQKAALREAGLDDEAIRNLTPQQAQDALRAARPGEGGAAPGAPARAPMTPLEAEAASVGLGSGGTDVGGAAAATGAPSPVRAEGAAAATAPSRTTARAADTPIPAGQWSDVVANARLGAVSAMADADASRAADASIAARSTAAQEARAVQEETDAALADIDHIAGADPVLKAAVDTEMAAADLTADAAAYGRAGEAMASCMLRRGVA